MQRRTVLALFTIGLLTSWIATPAVLAHEGDEMGMMGTDQTIQGEVTDVMCYLSHGEAGLGQKHVDCAMKCIKSGLPVAIKVGDKLYLAVSADHQPLNAQLADLAGQQVKATGHVMERDGQTLIAIERVEAVQ